MHINKEIQTNFTEISQNYSDTYTLISIQIFDVN
jgi:hypothetical protein